MYGPALTQLESFAKVATLSALPKTCSGTTFPQNPISLMIVESGSVRSISTRVSETAVALSMLVIWP